VTKVSFPERLLSACLSSELTGEVGAGDNKSATSIHKEQRTKNKEQSPHQRDVLAQPV